MRLQEGFRVQSSQWIVRGCAETHLGQLRAQGNGFGPLSDELIGRFGIFIQADTAIKAMLCARPNDESGLVTAPLGKLVDIGV